MIGAVLDVILGPLGAILGGIAAMAAAYFKGKLSGEKELKNAIRKDAEDRRKAGRDAVARGRSSGSSPADRLRANDGDWGGL